MGPLNTVKWIIFAMGLCLSACGSVAPKESLAEKTGKTPDPIRLASRMIGKPYRFGGSRPETGFDCSGLMYFSYRQQIPRTSILQYRSSKAVKKGDLRPGDLVFFNIGYTKIKKSRSKHKVSHVGLYIGKGQFIHAPSSGKRVMQSSLQEKYWRQRFLRGGRFSLSRSR